MIIELRDKIAERFTACCRSQLPPPRLAKKRPQASSFLLSALSPTSFLAVGP
jgi:hypothetical protein